MADNQPQKSLTVRGRFWARHLQRWKQSGLSQAQYCRQQQLSAPALGWWRRQLTTAPRKTAVQNGSFVELTRVGGGVPAPRGEVVYEIVLRQCRCLRLGPGFELERVRQLLDLLERSC